MMIKPYIIILNTTHSLYGLLVMTIVITFLFLYIQPTKMKQYLPVIYFYHHYAIYLSVIC